MPEILSFLFDILTALLYCAGILFLVFIVMFMIVVIIKTWQGRK